MCQTAMTFKIILTCAESLENALLTELELFGMTAQKIAIGRVSVSASLVDIYTICLYSRVASRVLLPVAEHYFDKSQDGTPIFDDVPSVLYDTVKAIDWTQILSSQDTFVVKTSVDKRVTVNQKFATMRIKDAIVDCFYENQNTRPNVNTQNPDFVISVHIGLDKTLIALDLSGTSLHRRGYRVANTDAPLKENLASALLYTANWHTFCGQDKVVLIDPMCGSGTFIIEALLMYFDYPVGIDKASNSDSGFGFYKWAYHDENLWQNMTAQALDNFHYQLTHKPKIRTIATDSSRLAVTAMRKNVLSSALASVIEWIDIDQKDLNQLSDTLQSLNTDDKLFLITNPPYGERLGQESLLKPLYQGLALTLKKYAPKNSVISVLAGKAEELDLLPFMDSQTVKCYNGAINVYFRTGNIYQSLPNDLIYHFEKKSIQIDNDDNLEEFINRIQKNLVNLKKHAKKSHITNLRIYDADLPNFNVAIDIYGDKVHIQEYAPPKQIDEAVAKRRFNLVLLVLRQLFDINKEDIYIKTRAKQSKNEQYTKQNNKNKRFIVQENKAYFYVNFTDYLDTGLFIDHRNMRQILFNSAYQKRVLNLYAYTCTASVQSALGGALSVTSVDLSDNYLQWGQDNFALNGFDLDKIVDNKSKFEFISADVFEWIKHNTDKFDLIFIDPPTFSNSKKFYGTFDVQRDHTSLIKRAMNRLTDKGVLYFSNNFSKFVLDENLHNHFDICEITAQTTGFDFKKSIHKSYEIRHKNGVYANTADNAQNNAQDNTKYLIKNQQNFDKNTDDLNKNIYKKSHKNSNQYHLHKDKPNNDKHPKNRIENSGFNTQNRQKDRLLKDKLTKDDFVKDKSAKSKKLSNTKSDFDKKSNNQNNAKYDKSKYDKLKQDKQGNFSKFVAKPTKNFEKRLIATGENKRIVINPKHQTKADKSDGDINCNTNK